MPVSTGSFGQNMATFSSFVARCPLGCRVVGHFLRSPEPEPGSRVPNPGSRVKGPRYTGNDACDDDPGAAPQGSDGPGRRRASHTRRTVVKQSARKIRRLYNETILAGFAGSAADSFALFSRFESKLEQYRGNLERAAVELARDWRTDRYLRRLEAMLVVADRKSTFLLSGTGDLIEPDDGVVAVGSGGAYAMAAARALVRHSSLSARQIAEESMRIAADICIYTNPNITIEEL